MNMPNTNVHELLPTPDGILSAGSDPYNRHNDDLSIVSPVELLPHFPGDSPIEQVLRIERRKRREEGVRSLQTIIGQAEVINQANIEPVTGLRSRNAFSKEYPHIFSRKQEGELTVIYFDVNGLKRVNDSEENGHSAGDKYLATTAQAIVTSLRPTDLVYRIGGDEFAAILEGTIDPSNLDEIKKRIKAKVDVELKDKMPHKEELYLGISVGIATKNEKDDDDTLLQRADKLSIDDKNAFYERIREQTGLDIRAR